MATDRSLTVKLGAQLGDFQRGLSQAVGSYDGFLRSVGGGKNILTSAAVGIAAIGAALIGIAKQTSATGDRFDNLSKQTGITVEELSLLRFALEQSDTSLDIFAAGIKKFSQGILDAQRGLKTYTVLFDALGVAYQDNEGNVRKMGDVILDVADKFSELEDGTEKAALAQKLFGGAGLELIPFLNEGRAGIEELTKKAREMGLEFSTEAAASASDFSDQINELKFQFLALSESIGKELIPPLTDFLEILNDKIDTVKDWVDTMNDWVEAYRNFKIEAGLLAPNPNFIPGEEIDFGFRDLSEGPNDALRKRLSLALQADELRKKELEASREHQKAEREREQAAKKANDQVRAGEQIQIAALGEYLEIRKLYGKADEEYFLKYRTLLELQGKSSFHINALIAKEVIETREETAEKEKQIVVTTNELIREGARGVADALKGIWRKQNLTFEDVWKNALDNFVDVMAEMVVQAAVAGTKISLSMAAASAALTFGIGLLGSLIGGGGQTGPSKLEQAERSLQSTLKSFLDAIRDSLTAFEEETSTTLENLTRNVTGVRVNFEDIFQLINLLPQILNLRTSAPSHSEIQRIEQDYRDVFALLPEGFEDLKGQVQGTFIDLSGVRGQAIARIRETIVKNLDSIKIGLEDKFALEKRLLNEVKGIIRSQIDFTKDLDRTIIDVKRDLFTPEELFEAQKGDIQRLTGLVAAAQGEEKLSLVNELRDAYIASFRTAKEIFQENPEELRRWQQFVIAGLEGVKRSGKTAFDQLIDIALEELGLSRKFLFNTTRQTDLQKAIDAHLQNQGESIIKILKVLETIATAEISQLGPLGQELARLLRLAGIEVPGFAHGGVVTRRTLATIGEAGPEAVIPLSKLSNFGAGNYSISISFPNIKSLGELSVGKAEQILKTSLTEAARNLSRRGHKWPMNIGA